MIPITEEEDLFTMELNKLWAIAGIMRDTDELNRQDTAKLEELRKGININMNILYLMKGWYKDQPNYELVEVLGHGKYDIYKFYEEKEAREQELRKIIFSHLNNEEITAPRGNI